MPQPVVHKVKGTYFMGSNSCCVDVILRIDGENSQALSHANLPPILFHSKTEVLAYPVGRDSQRIVAGDGNNIL